MVQRMKIHMSGMKVPKLGSSQDIVYRQYLTKESHKEAKKNQLLALLVTNSISFDSSQEYQKWAERVKKVWTSYLGLEYGMEIPEHDEKETEMMNYYANRVKNLKAKLTVTKDGKPVVSGLDSLLE
jgi:hypothetical protein